MTVQVNLTNYVKKIQTLQHIPANVVPDTYKFFRNLTPIAAVRGGNARNNTSLQGRTIVANYPYAFVLDAGRGYRDGQMRGSDQAPQGMSGPTIQYYQQRIHQALQAIKQQGK
jgi:hypothetical protein